MPKLKSVKVKELMNVTTFVSKQNSMSIGNQSNSFVKKIGSFIGSPRRILFIVLAIFAAIGIYSIFNRTGAFSDSKVLPLNQKFEIVAKTQDGKVTNGKLAVELTSAQKTDSVLVQGQRVYARNGKVFLLINMEITDKYLVPLYMYPVDAFRLVTADGKKFSPTAHQGNVEIRPESTKTSNVGFIVPQDQKKFKVEVGALDSDKQVLEFTIN